MTLPPFPVDDRTLDLLGAALDPRGHGDASAERTCVGDFLRFMSELGGSDTEAVESIEDGIHMMRDPQYHEHDIIGALIEEIRRLRKEHHG